MSWKCNLHSSHEKKVRQGAWKRRPTFRCLFVCVHVSWMSLSALLQERRVHDKLSSLIKATSGGADSSPPTVGHHWSPSNSPAGSLDPKSFLLTSAHTSFLRSAASLGHGSSFLGTERDPSAALSCLLRHACHSWPQPSLNYVRMEQGNRNEIQTKTQNNKCTALRI